MNHFMSAAMVLILFAYLPCRGQHSVGLSLLSIGLTEDGLEQYQIELEDSIYSHFTAETKHKALVLLKLWGQDSLQNSRVSFRSRISSKNYHLGFQVSRNHSALSLAAQPCKNLNLFFGSLGGVLGHDLLLATQKPFSYWRKSPVQHLARRDQIRPYLGSDTLRVLQGAGVKWTGKRIVFQAITSAQPQTDERLEVSGLHFKLKYPFFELGGGMVHLTTSVIPITRLGLHLKMRQAATLIQGAAVLDSEGGWAGDWAICFFGSEKQTLMLEGRHRNKRFYSTYSRLESKSVADANLHWIHLNYALSLSGKNSIQLDLETHMKTRSVVEMGDLITHRVRFGHHFRLYPDFEVVSRLDFQQKGWIMELKARKIINDWCTFALALGQIKGSGSYQQQHSRYFSTDWIWRFFATNSSVHLGTVFFTGSLSGLYRYEPDVYFHMSLPALSGNGYRSYILIKHHVCTEIKLEAKLFVTHEFGQEADRDIGFRVQMVYRPDWISQKKPGLR